MIWEFSVAPIMIHLFTICSMGPDTTPPLTADAFVEGRQIDSESVVVHWGGFRDPESKVRGYTVCLGSSPGYQNLALCTTVGKAYSHLFTGLNINECIDGQTFYASVFAANGESLESLLSDSMVIDYSGPEVRDVQFKQEWEGGGWTSGSDRLYFHGHETRLSFRFWVEERATERYITPKVIEWSLGASNSTYTDVVDWTEIGQTRQLERGAFGPYYATAVGVHLKHQHVYYLHFKTTNNLGLQSITTHTTPIFIDSTPPYHTGHGTHDGNTIMLEYLLDYLPLDASGCCDPKYSSMYWQQRPLFNWRDTETFINRQEVWVEEASSGVEVPNSRVAYDAFRLLRFDSETRANITADMRGFLLDHNTEYRLHFWARNDVGLSADAVSEPWLIDKTRPQVLQVMDLDADMDNADAIFPLDLTGGFAVPGLLTPAQEFALELDFVQELRTLRMGFAAFDLESGIDRAFVAVGDAPGANNVMDWTEVELSGPRSRVFTFDLPAGSVLEEHKRYHASIMPVNRAGLWGKPFTTDGIMIDTTPPIFNHQRILDGDDRAFDAEYWSNPVQFTASWRASFLDLESLVSHYTVTLVDETDDSVLFGPANVGPAERVVMNKIVLQHNHRVRVDITATNRAGGNATASTSGALLDLTGPVPDETSPAYAAAPLDVDGSPRVVWDGNDRLRGYAGEDMQFAYSRWSVFGSWVPFEDPESTVRNYWVWAETPSGQRLSDKFWVSRSVSDFTLQMEVALGHGDTAHFVVAPENRAGSATPYRSDGTTVDLTGPRFRDDPVLYSEENMRGNGANTVVSVDGILTLRAAARDEESPLTRCRYAVGTYPGGDDVVRMTTAEITGDPATGLVIDDDGWYVLDLAVAGMFDGELAAGQTTSLLNGRSYYGTVKCENEARAFYAAVSPLPVFVDLAPPVVGVVSDGLPGRRDKDFMMTNDTYVGNYRWFFDAESDIVSIRTALGTTAGASDLRDWKESDPEDGGVAYMSFFEGNALPSGVPIFLSVRAEDSAGNFIVASSDSIVVDNTPPTVDGATVAHGLGDIEASLYTSLDIVLLQWSGLDDEESGIVGYEFGLASVRDGIDVPDLVPYVNIGTATQAAVTNFELEHGRVYYGAVRATNGVGLRAQTFSDGVLADLTGPSCSIRDSLRGEQDVNITLDGVVRSYATCSDLESGIAELMYGLGTIPGADDVIPLHPVVFTRQTVSTSTDGIAASLEPRFVSPNRSVDVEQVVTDIELVDGATYFAVVRAVSGAGAPVYAVSNGVGIDGSPPTSVFKPRDIMREGNFRDVDFSSGADSWAASYMIRDPHSGVHYMTLSFKRQDLATDDVVELESAELPVSSAPGVYVGQRIGTDYTLDAGYLYWVEIVAVNNVDLSSTHSTDGFAIDTTPPEFTAEGVTDGSTFGADTEFQGGLGFLSACWHAEDDDSYVSMYELAVREVGAADGEWVRAFQSVPAGASAATGSGQRADERIGRTCYAASGFDIVDGEAYEVVVRAVNKAGLATTSSSNGITVDATAPTVGRIVIGAPGLDSESLVSEATSSSAESISVAWADVVDTGSEVVAATLLLGRAPGSGSVNRVTLDVAVDLPGGAHAFDEVSLSDGVTYYATLQVSNAAGLTASYATPGLLVDSTAPVEVDPLSIRWSYPQQYDTQPHYDTFVSESSLTVAIAGIVDTDSPVDSLSVAVYVLDSTEYADATTATQESLLSLADAADDVAVSEDGNGVVTGLTADGSVSWGTEALKYAATSDAAGKLRVVFDDIVLQDTTWLFTVVQATNRVGLTLSAVSTPVQVTTEGLTAGIVLDGWTAGADLDYQTSVSSYSATWAGWTDPTSSSIVYRVALGSDPSDPSTQNDIVDWVEVGDDTQISFLDHGMVDVVAGTVVYATVEGETDLGLTAQASSSGLRMSSLPPSVTDVRLLSPNDSDEEHSAYLPASPIIVAWDVEQQGSGVRIDSCTVALGPAPHSSEYFLRNVASTVDSVVLTNQAEGDVSLAEGDVVYATVTCANEYEQTDAAFSEHSILESTPPTIGVVRDGTVESSEWQFGSSISSASVNWHSFSDPESEVTATSLCFASQPLGCDIAGPLDLAPNQSPNITLSGLELHEGSSYFWTVTVFNGLGLNSTGVSDGFTVDVTPPSAVAAEVADGDEPGVDVDGAKSIDFLGVSWDGFVDVLSGIHHFELTLGSVPGGSDVIGTTFLDSTRSSHVWDLSSQDVTSGSTLYSTVVAVDGAGLRTEVSSDGVYVDSTPPVPGGEGVLDGPWSLGGPDTDVLGGRGLAAHWYHFEDDDQSLLTYTVRVEDVTSRPATVVMDWTPVGHTTEFQNPAVELQNGHSYVTHLCGKNPAGWEVCLSTDGFSVDDSPPAGGVAWDIGMTAGSVATEDIDFASSFRTVGVGIDGFRDAESVLSHFEWCVGSAAGREDILPCRNVGLNTRPTATYDELNLTALFLPVVDDYRTAAELDTSIRENGGSVLPSIAEGLVNETSPKLLTWVSKVSAFNEGGLSRTVYSDGVLLDAIPPFAGVVVDGDAPGARDVDYQASPSSIAAHWLDFADYQTGISDFLFAVGSEPELADVVPETSVGSGTLSHRVDGLELSNGAEYHVAITAVDEAGHRTTVVSDGVTVDYTPPAAEYVRDWNPEVDDSAASTSVRSMPPGTPFHAEWSWSDTESGIAQKFYRVCPVSVGVVPCLVEWTPAFDADVIDSEALQPVAGVVYRLEARAVNGAGIVAVVQSPSSFYIDETEPEEGTVSIVNGDGLASTNEELPHVSFVSTLDGLAAEWRAWRDAESGISEFQLCVGSSPLAEDIMSCRSTGLETSTSIDVTGATAFADEPRPEPDIKMVYATVIAFNGAGLNATYSSRATQLDTSAPVAGVVLVGSGATDIEYWGRADLVCVTVEGFDDPETGISHWELGIGSGEFNSADSANIVDWQSAEVEGSDGEVDGSRLQIMCLRDLPANALQHGDDIFVGVRAWNKAGLSTIATSTSTIVLTEGPSVGNVVDLGHLDNDTDVDLLPRGLRAAARWTGFGDGDSIDVAHYEVALCGDVTGCDDPETSASFWANVGLSTEISFVATELLDGASYRFHVKAVGPSGAYTEATSDGFVVDSTPPEHGDVVVLNVAKATSELSAQGVAFDNDALDDAELAVALGLASDESVPAFVSTLVPLHVAWPGFYDGDCGIAGYEVCVGTVNATDDLVACTAFDAQTSYTVFDHDAFDEAVLNNVQSEARLHGLAGVRVTVRASNALGLMVRATGEVAVDLTPPEMGTVLRNVDENGAELPFVTSEFSLTTQWSPAFDSGSSVAFYTWSLVQENDGSDDVVVDGPYHVGSSLFVETHHLQLQQSKRYHAEVTAFNFAGLSAVVTSAPMEVDMTPPQGGVIFDGTRSGFDRDWGDADVAEISAHWYGWHDPESRLVDMKWAVLAIDPRAGGVLEHSLPGTSLRDHVEEFVVANGIVETAVDRPYYFGHSGTLWDVVDGVRVTDWVDMNVTADGGGQDERNDVDITPGFTYVVLLRLVNGAGLVRVVATDGVVFSGKDPCLGKPVPGLDPHTTPKWLTVESELSASWAAAVDPRYQQASMPNATLPFECLPDTGSDVPVDVAGSDRSAASVEGHLAPISHFEWKLIHVVPSNETDESLGLVNPREADRVPLNESVLVDVGDAQNTTTSVSANSTTPPRTRRNATASALAEADNSTNYEVVIDAVLAGDLLASPWSGCCSAYSEHDTQTLGSDWDWRPISPMRGYGHELAMIQGRCVAVASNHSVVLFDPYDPRQVALTVSADSEWVAIAGGDAAVIVQPALLQFIALGVEADVRPGDAEFAEFLAERHDVAIFRYELDVDGISGTATFDGESTAFAPAAFTGAAASAGDIVVASVAGVLGDTAARAVAVWSTRVDGVTHVVNVQSQGIAVDVNPSFGEAVAVSSGIVAVGSPGMCRQIGARRNVTALAPFVPCAGEVAHSEPDSGGRVVVFAVEHTEQGSTSQLAELATLESTDGSSFGSTLAAAPGLLVVADVQALQDTGRVTIFRVPSAATFSSEADSVGEVCTLTGQSVGSMFGYSLSVAAADAEGKSSDFPENAGTYLVVVGVPGQNEASIIRVNLTAFEAGASGRSVCQTVSVARQARLAQSSSPLYGVGTSVAIGGGMVVYGAPFLPTWPVSGSGRELPGTMDGTGKVFGIAYCWSGDRRVPFTSSDSNVPLVCSPCDAAAAENSLGGAATVCEDCAARVCSAGPDSDGNLPSDSFYFSAINSSAPLENGHEYMVDVIGVGAHERTNTQRSASFRVDWTPPPGGVVRDRFMLDNTTDCLWCSDDIDYNFNTTYLAASWCCGFEDPESPTVGFSVMFGTAPGVDDIVDWTNVGYTDVFNVSGLDLAPSTTYYACVVAENEAGLFSNNISCSDGVTIDNSPPQVLAVRDGINGPDVDAQSFVNMAFVNYVGEDAESPIVEYEMSFGSEPGMTDVWEWSRGGDALLNGLIDSIDLQPGSTLYANVRATNILGMVSAVQSADGVVVGKAEVAPSKTEPTVMSLDTQRARPTSVNDKSSPQAVEDTGVTVGAVEFPPGAAGDSGASFVGGTPTEEDLASGDAVDPDETPPPAQNFRFGDYSFTLKARDPDSGEIAEGFVFEEPVIIHMFYNVDQLLEGEQGSEDWAPSMQIYSADCECWIEARDTCDDPWDEVQHDIRRYSVAICHLTQFALWFQQRPIAILTFVGDAGSTAQWVSPEDSWAVSQRAPYVPADVAEGIVSSGVPPGTPVLRILLRRDENGSLLPSEPFDLDSSSSFDPDGTAVTVQWSQEAVHSNLGSSELVQFADDSASVAEVTAVAGGVGRVTLIVTDADGSMRDASLWLVLNAPPIAVLPSATVLVHLDPKVPDPHVRVDGSDSYDPDGAPLLYVWSIDAASVAARYSGGDTGTPTIGASPVAPEIGLLTGVRAGTTLSVLLEVDDAEGGVHETAVDLVLNSLPEIDETGVPRAVWLPDADIFIDVGEPIDRDGSVVRFEWNVTAITPLDDAAQAQTPVVADLNTTAPSITGLLGRTRVQLELEVEDNEGGILRREFIIVVKEFASAVASADQLAVVSASESEGMTVISVNGHDSADGGGSIQSYDWTVVATDDPRGVAAATQLLASPTSVETQFGPGYGAYEYVLQLTVVDSLGVTLIDTTTIRVLLVAAVSAPTVNTVDDAPAELSAEASAVWSGTQVLGYRWVVDAVPDGASSACTTSIETESSLASAAQVHGACVTGTYSGKVTVVVDDLSGGQVSQSARWHVYRHLSPRVAVSPDDTVLGLVVGQEFDFDASGSTDPEGTSLSFEWSTHPAAETARSRGSVSGQAEAEFYTATDLNNADGEAAFASSSDSKVSMVPTAIGSMTVRLTVTDSDGGSAAHEVDVAVFDDAAQASAFMSPPVVDDLCEGFLCGDEGGIAGFAVGMFFVGVCVVCAAVLILRPQARRSVKKRLQATQVRRRVHGVNDADDEMHVEMVATEAKEDDATARNAEEAPAEGVEDGAAGAAAGATTEASAGAAAGEPTDLTAADNGSDALAPEEGSSVQEDPVSALLDAADGGADAASEHSETSDRVAATDDSGPRMAATTPTDIDATADGASLLNPEDREARDSQSGGAASNSAADGGNDAADDVEARGGSGGGDAMQLPDVDSPGGLRLPPLAQRTSSADNKSADGDEENEDEVAQLFSSAMHDYNAAGVG